MSVWYTATEGTRSRRAAASPRAPTTKGEARCITSGPKEASAVSTVLVGTPIGSELTTGSSTAGIRMTGAPRYSAGPARPGATTSTSSPRTRSLGRRDPLVLASLPAGRTGPAVTRARRRGPPGQRRHRRDHGDRRPWRTPRYQGLAVRLGHRHRPHSRAAHPPRTDRRVS